MISLIVCTKNKNSLSRLEQNIKDTIGAVYELIVVEDAEGSIGICKAYNQGASQAKYEFLCFMHDDIAYETPDWGPILCNLLADKSIGLIGVAGGIVKTKVPSDWKGRFEGEEIYMVQHFKFRNEAPLLCYKNYSKLILADVVSLDGTWLCSRKDVVDSVHFDEKTFTGFHGYDMDFSLQVFQTHRVCVSFEILIHHFSEGHYSHQWIESAFLICEKWGNKLPLYVPSFSEYLLSKVELLNMKWIMKMMLRNHYSFARVFGMLVKYSLKVQSKPALFIRAFIKLIEYKCRLFMTKKI